MYMYIVYNICMYAQLSLICQLNQCAERKKHLSLQLTCRGYVMEKGECLNKELVREKIYQNKFTSNLIHVLQINVTIMVVQLIITRRQCKYFRFSIWV